MPFDWTCPYCGRPTTVTDQDIVVGDVDLTIKNKYGSRRSRTIFIVCPNPKCKEIALDIHLFSLKNVGNQYNTKWEFDKNLEKWTLLPNTKGIVFPLYIPEAIRNDYNEARNIEERSPKAAATLARRCLQGMIHDFWNVKKDTLKQEIDAIRDKTDSLTWEAIHSVRKIGNIGAHMEKDINLIIDVEPQEASLLLGLIESLLQDWYINREERRKQLEDIKKSPIIKLP